VVLVVGLLPYLELKSIRLSNFVEVLMSCPVPADSEVFFCRANTHDNCLQVYVSFQNVMLVRVDYACTELYTCST